jgi:hypothetical protein
MKRRTVPQGARALGAAVGVAVGAAAACVLVASLHVRALGARAIVESDRAVSRGDVSEAIARARDAAMAVAPWSPYAERGYCRLEAFGEGAEARGDVEQAALAWRAVWTAARATRSEGRQAARMEEARVALVRLSRRACAGDPTKSPDDCAAVTEEALRRDVLPSSWSGAWLALGVVAFASGGSAWAALAGGGACWHGSSSPRAARSRRRSCSCGGDRQGRLFALGAGTGTGTRVGACWVPLWGRVVA